ncbi:MAG: phosphatase PAP2 family protein [Oscillospiraceae bacterium]|nr:phosphatase PAP2 family protein [Oscillospiraceae bacterium]
MKKFLAGGVSLCLFLVLLILVRTADVAAIGPEETKIGLSSLNHKVSEAIGVHMLWYRITEITGILAIGVAGVFALMGAVQLIRRRSLLKVDREILAAGGLYAVVLGLYALFEKVIVNYRPVIMEGDAHVEASFPSSHTMLICCVMGSAAMLLPNYIASDGLRRLLQAVCAAMIAVTVIGRLVSGVHWLTDILAGVLISLALLLFFAGILEKLRKAEKAPANA